MNIRYQIPKFNIVISFNMTSLLRHSIGGSIWIVRNGRGILKGVILHIRVHTNQTVYIHQFPVTDNTRNMLWHGWFVHVSWFY